MNLNSTPLYYISFYYPIGNTPPMCLTQDLPPEQEADILLLGCGDARNVLFTCFADSARKIDVTCCDIEPMIHARNVLLYTLLIDDETNSNIDCIWNIYYHWKIDENSLQLLESQTDKLLRMSESIDHWHNSVYGSTIRFCSEVSLSTVRRYWGGFTTKGLTAPEKKNRLSQFQASIDRAKTYRSTYGGPSGVGHRATYPTANQNDASANLSKVSQQWWDFGFAPASNSSANSLYLNPALLYAPDTPITLYYYMSPVGGIPLSTAYTAISKGSPLYSKITKVSSTERLVNCAKTHFAQWALSFRKAVANRSVIRIFSGDALAFCLSLRNCQLSQSTSMNLFCHSYTSEPLILHPSEYGANNNAAPLSFNIIDTSNLSDLVGPLNLMALGSCLLKHHVSSCLYTETLVLHDRSSMEHFSSLLSVDVQSISFLLGLVPPYRFTNVMNSVEEDRNFGTTTKETVAQARSRFRWKRSGGSQASCVSLPIQIEANELAAFLIQVYVGMFRIDEISWRDIRDPLAWFIEQRKLQMRSYTRASFAFLLSVLKMNITTDWNKCLKKMYDELFPWHCSGSIRGSYKIDLALNLYNFGVDDRFITKADPANMQNPTLASIFRKLNDLPDQVCVTLRVPRKCLNIFTKEFSSMAVICTFKGRGLLGEALHSFSSVQIVFGKWHDGNGMDNSHPFIEEDLAGQRGTLDMFASVIVPTSMLIALVVETKNSVPLVSCGVKYSGLNIHHFTNELGAELRFSMSKITSKNVFITRFMPGMSGLPKFTASSNHLSNATSDVTVAHLSKDSSKINSLSKRITLESDADKAKLAMKSTSVNVEFESPLIAVVTFTGSQKFQLEFPVPLSISKYKVKIARKSSYIEVESSFFDPLTEDAPAFLLPCFLTKVPSGIVPVSWTLGYIDLDAMPPIDVDRLQQKDSSWLHRHTLYMFSVHEKKIRSSNSKFNFRMSLKEELLDFYMVFAGFADQKCHYFGLSIHYAELLNVVHTIIIPSCIRLDLANNSVVLDCALVPMKNSMEKDPLMALFRSHLKKSGVDPINLGEADNCAWKAMMPALVERCRTWKHAPECEYIKTGEVPLSKGLKDIDQFSICSCGIGKFPKGYLKEQVKRFPPLSCVLNRFGTRIAVPLIFPVPYIEDCNTDLRLEKCKKCGSQERKIAKKDEQNLLTCSRCKKVKYCSADCQKADWKGHKPFCKTT